MSTPSSAAADDDGTASTSLVRFGDTIRANIEMLADRAKGNWKQNMEQFEQISFRSIAVPVFGEARLAKWDAGWERVKDIYRLEQTMEWRILKMAFCTGFGTRLNKFL
ncbi:hypothetical protein niasHT_038452 [Heterodera trifolii]|uniref:Uncharacterized protein n=1 Tax=Heterodera trifolii TaxID=157864 RepID=A0ABD2IST9_9BILA